MKITHETEVPIPVPTPKLKTVVTMTVTPEEAAVFAAVIMNAQWGEVRRHCDPEILRIAFSTFSQIRMEGGVPSIPWHKFNRKSEVDYTA